MIDLDATLTPCRAFGGGWLTPLTPAGRSFVARQLGVAPEHTPPHPAGFVVEPWQVREIAEAAEAEGIAVELGGEG